MRLGVMALAGAILFPASFGAWRESSGSTASAPTPERQSPGGLTTAEPAPVVGPDGSGVFVRGENGALCRNDCDGSGAVG